ncbi:GntR family transcriptional regulator [Microbacterium sp. Bi128]|uniref:GntR family transcriptional regulator n=1 Tax=Microbacterium sp. Bi128 TaxID=2821115 RepID=UPI001DC43C7D|nr:GntR family transcriptional regulator [Microbacterium sp. Bi128]CAH0146113.1 HTH-type transcriptional repressor YtrA [Microbacterium sp. Bi128]
MDIRVDPASTTPPFAQVRVQIIAMIASGALPTGTRLPPVRALATDLGLAANTVARVYKELEEARFVETRGRAGTFVSAGTDATRERAAAAAAEFARAMRDLGLEASDALDLARAALGNGSGR